MTDKASAFKSFFVGVGFLWRGLRWLGGRPGLLVLGAVPPLIVGAVFLTLMIVLLFNVQSLVLWLTPFVEGGPEWLATSLRLLLGVTIVAGAAVLMVLMFAGVSLAVGAPIYDRIAAAVDAELGIRPDLAGHENSVWASIGNALKLLIIAIPISLGVFLVSLIPFVGSVLGAVLGAFAGGRALALEMTAGAMDARGVSAADHRKLVGGQRAKTMGFGVATYLLLLVPVIAIVAMPVATVAGVLMARDLHGEPVD